MKTLIIAEAGVNHNGSIDMALELVEKAAEAGVDIVKFQTFKAENVISLSAPKAEYQKAATGAVESQLDMVRKLELDGDQHERLLARCQELGIEFLSTPFDVPSAELLFGRLDVRRLKIPSGEVTNAPFVLALARYKLPTILSTGMATLGEIEAALGVIAHAFIDSDLPPGPEAFAEAYISDEGQKALRENVSLLHCTTEYPAPFAETNLRAMDTMAAAFSLPVGFSDHTLGISAPVAAVARGATIIEKHFTLDRTLPGPDHAASLEPQEMRDMVRSIREVEQALGNGMKLPGKTEIRNKVIARRSLVALCHVKAGEIWTAENLGCKRPGNGISPYEFWNYLGTPADKDYEQDDILVKTK